jgi:Ner family transcriptional regulator
LDRPWRKGELIIANEIGVPASIIWPSRYYNDNGELIERPMRNAK